MRNLEAEYEAATFCIDILQAGWVGGARCIVVASDIHKKLFDLFSDEVQALAFKGTIVLLGDFMPAGAWVEHHEHKKSIFHQCGLRTFMPSEWPQVSKLEQDILESKAMMYTYSVKESPAMEVAVPKKYLVDGVVTERIDNTAEVEKKPKRAQREIRQLEPKLRGELVSAFERELSATIIGQSDAVTALVHAYQVYVAGMTAQHKPVAVLLFAGPTGVGKSKAAEAAAERLLGIDKLITIDCAEFQHSHEISKLIGSPPGYLGHRETSPILTQEVLTRQYSETCHLSFVLFDEIEKASDALWNLLLGITGKASMTTGDNRHVDFSNTAIIMTSNLGASDMSRILTGSAIGFAQSEKNSTKLNGAVTQAIQKRFTPEFMNRIDRTVIFNPLKNEDLQRIFVLEMQDVQQRILDSKCAPIFVLSWTQAAADYIIARGTDARYGARELKRTIEKLVVHPLTNLISSHQIESSDTVTVDVANDELTFTDTPPFG